MCVKKVRHSLLEGNITEHEERTVRGDCKLPGRSHGHIRLQEKADLVKYYDWWQAICTWMAGGPLCHSQCTPSYHMGLPQPANIAHEVIPSWPVVLFALIDGWGGIISR